MITISLCMIVKNEEDTLEHCLGSVSDFVDEIVITDTGSTDNTKEIARKFTEKVYDFKWINDFSAARNFSYERATMDYILWLDADDILLPGDRERFKRLKHTLRSDVDAVMMRYNTAFDENGNPVFFCYRERLSKRARGFRWREPVHEYLQINGNISRSDVCVTHAKPITNTPSTRNLDIYEEMIKAGGALSARGMYYYARELKDHARYADAVRQFEQFMDRDEAWVEDRINACAELSRCYLSLGDRERALSALTRSFAYDSPRAEICCQIGYFFKETEHYAIALFWFELAQTLDMPKEAHGFIQIDCWGYIPCLECVVCYDKLGDHKKAEHYNSKAALFKPDSRAVAFNKQYFEQLKKGRTPVSV